MSCLRAFMLVAVVAMPRAQEPSYARITPERVAAAHEDARRACARVLKVEFEAVPLKIGTVREVAALIAEENLPIVKLREPDAAVAEQTAKELGKQLGFSLLAKYSWSRKEIYVVPSTWLITARLLAQPELTSDEVLRVILVHELCHALDDRRFDLGKRLSEATTTEAVTAFNAVLEGHAQLATRRVCAVSGWGEAFELFTRNIGTVPQMDLVGEAMMTFLRNTAIQTSSAYYDGERFVTAVLAARPDSGLQDLFTKPPQDPETILHPDWYLDPTNRPPLRYAVEPALTAFGARFASERWRHERSLPTSQGLAMGLAGLAETERADVVASLRAVHILRVKERAAKEEVWAHVCAIQFDSPESALRFLAYARSSGEHKAKSMARGLLRVANAEFRNLQFPTWRGLLETKELRAGPIATKVVVIDAVRDCLLIETCFSGEVPTPDEHVELVDLLLSQARAR